jgi:N-acetylmuramoyl-L-alanine amidase
MKSIDPKETREWTLNNRICDKIEAKLKDYEGYELIRLDDTTGEKDIALKTRTTKANEFKADFYLSIHHNAGIKGGKGGGIVAYTYTAPSAAAKDWQSALYSAIVDRTGLRGNRSKPLATKNLHECRESNMPCVLIECGFMDSTTDTPIILTETFAENVAIACVEVLVKKGGLTKKVAKVETSETTYIVKKGDTLSAIAKLYGTTYKKLAAYNGIDNPKLIYVGQVIKIPNNEKKPATTKPAANYFPKYTGTSSSIVTGLNAVGATSTYTYRKSIAAANGIEGYKGTAAQNGTMLKLLKQGKLKKP